MGVAERKAREFKRREEEILTAAFELFKNKGLENVTIDMIADAVEIGKGTIYNHFKSKHEIYAALFIRHLDLLQHEIEAIDKSLPYIEQFKQIVRVYIKCGMSDRDNNRVFQKCMRHFTPENLGPELLEKVKYYHRIKHEQHIPLIQQAIDEGVIIDVPPVFITLIGAGLLQGVGEMLSENHFELDIENSEELFQLIETVLVKGFSQ